jgi:hypothetical protein
VVVLELPTPEITNTHTSTAAATAAAPTSATLTGFNFWVLGAGVSIIVKASLLVSSIGQKGDSFSPRAKIPVNERLSGRLIARNKSV